MKLLYKSKRYKHFNSLRSKKAMKKKSKTRKPSHSIVTNNNSKHKKRCHISAPNTFSIVYNSSDTIAFLTAVNEKITKNIPLFIDLNEVIQITPDAIIYLLILIKEADNNNVSIYGNGPHDPNAFAIFLQSGFYNYVKSPLSSKKITNTIDILRIINGKDIDRENISNFQDFLKKHIPKLEKGKLQAFYTILLECMTNTYEYASKKAGEMTWWTMALHDKKTDKILFAFADNGVGIPETVRLKVIDKFKFNDAEILEQAVSGQYNCISGSKLETRNRGLPQIRKLNENDLISNLVFVSNNGYYSINTGPEKLNKKFTGTMISWELTNVRGLL